MSLNHCELGQLVSVKTGKLDANAANENGMYPFFTCAKEPLLINQYAFDADAILVAGNGDLNVKHYKGKFNAYQRTYVITIDDPTRLCSRYLFHFMDKYVDRLREQSIGGVIKYIKLGMLTEAKLPLPTLEEQKRIAAILDKADAIRQKRQQAIALADDFLRSVFLNMFGDDISSENNVVSLGDVVTLDAPMVDPREEMYADLLHIGPDRIEKNTGRLLPALTAREEGLISKKFVFNDEYVLYSKIRPYLKKVAISNFTGLCSADMYPVKPVDGKTTKEFLWMLLLSDLFDSYIKSLAERANIPKLNRKELAAFKFALPDFKKIEAFTDVVKKTTELKRSNQSSCTRLEKIFNSLSQKAFTGQL
ncbi:restriction endonuclease subunit S [Aeromonas media]|uniref:restriction endonuclease subunit S n=1 Tax=Aeromonas media TaxID=651 RepID=UPI00223F43A1|nr:restriction endonuclease subunit S [Aeromonas media]